MRFPACFFYFNQESLIIINFFRAIQNVSGPFNPRGIGSYWGKPVSRCSWTINSPLFRIRTARFNRPCRYLLGIHASSKEKIWNIIMSSGTDVVRTVTTPGLSQKIAFRFRSIRVLTRIILIKSSNLLRVSIILHNFHCF